MKVSARHISRTLYNFKKMWPISIQLHKVSEKPVINFISGGVRRNLESILIRKAVALPRETLRKFVQDLAFVASSKNFTYGGLFDSSERVLMVDRKDLPPLYLVHEDDEVTVDSERFQVKALSELPYKTGYLMGLVRTHAGGRTNDST